MLKLLLQSLVGVVMMFWNVENCFDSFDDPARRDEDFTPSAARHWTWKKFERKRDGLVQVILAAGDMTGELPSVVGLAEVENRLVVSQIAGRTPLGELGYGYVHRESPDMRGIDVALLYRKDRLRVVAVDSLRIPGVTTRDILYTRFAAHGSPPDVNLHVLVVHLPSKLGGSKASAPRREAALGVLERAVDSLLQADPCADIVVMGDFNDTDNRVAGLVQAPSIPDSARTLPSAPGTLRYRGRWEQIDHFFVSPSLLPPRGESAMQIFAPAFLLEDDKTYLGRKPRRTYIGPRYNGGLSDHLPILLKISL